MYPSIPQNQLILTDTVAQDSEYRGLRIVRFHSNPEDNERYQRNQYQFQHQPEDYTVLQASLCRKGAPERYRVVAIVHPTLKLFIDLVKYDPANPPIDDYEAQGMIQAHKKTQSDFIGQKKANTADFKQYLLEGVNGDRTLYLPMITGWQAKGVFDKTVFVAMDENDPNALYGSLYLPKAPIMQADGQTQTAALFALAKTADARTTGALQSLTVSLEIELGVIEDEAAQSFADRNGRGSKKNRNLVIALDTISPLSDLRRRSIEGTVFEKRLGSSRAMSESNAAAKYVVDLSTMEQMLLAATTGGGHKPEHIKYHHVEALLPYCREFLTMLDELFGSSWPAVTPKGHDPFRKIYVHGWPFALKAIALAYYESRIDELGPISAAIGTEGEDHDANKSSADKFRSQVGIKKATWTIKPRVSFEELKDRLREIDWHRYRRHWIAITGSPTKDGKKKTFKLESTGELKVAAYAQNTAGFIGTVKDKILSNTWKDLCDREDEPL